MYVAKRRVNRQDLLRLARARVVTTEELGGLFNVSSSRAARIAFDLKRRGLLTKVKRGVYASVPLDTDPERFRPDQFVSVQKALGEGYAFSHFSALSLLGGERTVRRNLQVVARGARPRNRRVGELTVHIRSIAKRAWNSDTSDVRRGGVSVRVTTPERTLIDLAALPAAQQDYEEELAAYRYLLPRADLAALANDVRGVHQQKTLARVGHLIKASGHGRGELARLVSELRGRVANTSPSYFGTAPRSTGNRFDPEFKLVYPGAR
jgi:predicted transcriptional regulator of viral defense system